MSFLVNPPAIDQQDFEFISKFMFHETAIVLERSKSYLIESRLLPIARRFGLETIADIVTGIRDRGNRVLAQAVIDAMTTNETSFFRDVHPFNALKESIIPELLKKRAHRKTLNIWSNACSSGQEAYSIAMLLRENFPVLENWNLRLIASDISTVVLAKAQSGVFNQVEISRGLPETLLQKYFTQEEMQWRIHSEVRNLIEFKRINLIRPWPELPRMDIVFLRNVLIYFGSQTKSKILNQVHQSMAHDGYLFLGGAETTMNLDTKFTRTPVGNTFAYRP